MLILVLSLAEEAEMANDGSVVRSDRSLPELVSCVLRKTLYKARDYRVQRKGFATYQKGTTPVSNGLAHVREDPRQPYYTPFSPPVRILHLSQPFSQESEVEH